MRKLILALASLGAVGGSALAADLPARTYTKAPVMPEPVYNWTGFYIFGGIGGGVWDAKQDQSGILAGAPPSAFAVRDQRVGGDGWFGTVGAGFDWQFNRNWLFGVFADGQFGSLKGSLLDPAIGLEGAVKMQDAWAAGVRLGYLVSPNVLSYVNAGYAGSHWSGSTLSNVLPPALAVAGTATTPAFNRNGWFVGGGFENNLNIFGITAPGWFMKTEYRAAYYDRATIAETYNPPGLAGVLVGNDTFKPFVQTISTSLVYRFNGGDPVRSALPANLLAQTYAKAPAMREAVSNWTGFYLFGGVGGGVWDAKEGQFGTVVGVGPFVASDQRAGGDGWFGTVGAGYDWQFNRNWVFGVFADGQFGSLKGSLFDPSAGIEGAVTMQDAWAAGVRLGYLVSPNVLSYVNAGYTGSHWSGSTLSPIALTAGFGNPGTATTPAFNRNGWFVGGGVENNLNIFGITAPGWFMKTEYRAAYYDRVTLAQTCNLPALAAVLVVNDTFNPFVQTISTSLVYRFNWGGPVVAKY